MDAVGMWRGGAIGWLVLGVLGVLGALGLVSCAVRVAASPPRFEAVAFYGRITDCPGQPLQPQLQPTLGRRAPAEVDDAESDLAPTPVGCTSTEVGALSWANVITAIGTAAMAVFGGM